MKLNWSEKTLGELCDLGGGKIQTGPFGSQLHQSDYSDQGVPVVMPTDIQSGQIDTSRIARVSERHAQRLSRHELHPGDIVYGRRGDIGRQALVIPEQKGWLCGTGCLRVRLGSSEVTPEYLHRYLTMPSIIGWIQNQAIGATMPNLNTAILGRVPVYYPEVDSQQKIAAILTAYDDLIENNRKRIALLEKMAEEIYREWFVRMRFPGHQHTPVHKGVPEGWSIKLGDELFDTIKGRSYSSGDISDTATGHDAERPFITLKSVNRGGGYRREGLKFYRGRFNDEQVVSPGDVVMAVTDMTQNRAIVGQTARVPNLAECANAVISLDLVCLRPREWSETFLYSFCRFSGFASHLAQFANGANVLHLKPSVIGSQELLSPPDDLRQKFDSIIDPMLRSIDYLSEQTGGLTTTRDLLLNRLISGKLRVDDLDIQFPPKMHVEAA